MVAPHTGATPEPRLADPPGHASRPAAAVILLAVAVTTVLSLPGGGEPGPVGAVGPAGPVGSGAVLGMAVLVGATVLAFALRSVPAKHITLLCLLAVLAHLLPAAGMHPFPLGTALAAYAVVVFASDELRASVGWLHTGATDLATRRVAAIMVVVASAALIVWYLAVGPDMGELRAPILLSPVALWPVIAVFFALANAGIEELAFRGVLLEGLRSAVGDPAAVALQAVVFGVVHYAAGVPFGVSGAVLAAGLGLALGVLRLRTGGLLVVWLTHAAIDLVIFVLILAPPA